MCIILKSEMEENTCIRGTCPIPPQTLHLNMS